MTTAFSSMIDTLFEGDLTEDAVYTQKATGTSINIRAIIYHTSDDASYGDSTYRSNTTSIEIRATDIAAPQVGDQILIDSTTYTVQGKPKELCNRLVWALNVNDGDPV